LTYVVNESCIRCKTMDCVEVCPVDCFYEGAPWLARGSKVAKSGEGSMRRSHQLMGNQWGSFDSINGTAEMRALALQLQALALQGRKINVPGP